jgi:hypothetical protein
MAVGLASLVASGCSGGSPHPSPSITTPAAFVLTGRLTLASCQPVDQVSIVDATGNVVASEPVSVSAGANCRIDFEITVPHADFYRVQVGDQARLTLALGSGQRDFQWSGGISGILHAEPVGAVEP